MTICLCDGSGNYCATKGVRPFYEPWGPSTSEKVIVACPYCVGLKVIYAVADRAGEQVHVVAAVATDAAFAELVGLSLEYVTEWGATSRRAEDIEVAMAKPGAIFWGPDSNGPFTEGNWAVPKPAEKRRRKKKTVN